VSRIGNNHNNISHPTVRESLLPELNKLVGHFFTHQQPGVGHNQFFFLFLLLRSPSPSIRHCLNLSSTHVRTPSPPPPPTKPIPLPSHPIPSLSPPIPSLFPLQHLFSFNNLVGIDRDIHRHCMFLHSFVFISKITWADICFDYSFSTAASPESLNQQPSTIAFVQLLFCYIFLKVSTPS